MIDEALAFSADGQLLVSLLPGYTLGLWQVADGSMLWRSLKTTHGMDNDAAFSPDGQTLASGSADATVHLWRITDGALLRTLQGHTEQVWTVAFSPDGQTLASGSGDRTVRLWPME